MSSVRVQIEAAATDRSLVSRAPGPRKVAVDPQLLFWRRLIDSAMADAKKTEFGIPTYAAIAARWWIEEHQPSEKDPDEWERSFECACEWLNLQADAERKRVLELIDQAVHQAAMDYLQQTVYRRRAAMLSCAGIPTAIAKQFELPLVSEADYEQIAGIEYGDPPRVLVQLQAA